MNNIYEKIKRYLNEVGIQNINDFKDEIDSIAFIQMIVQIEQEFDISIDDDYLLIENFSDIDIICDYITKKCNEMEVVKQ